MASMAGTSSSRGSSGVKGFSILQPTLGAPLSWMPAVGTKELDQLIHAYMPGPASSQEKRAAVSIDFFEYCAQTGESFKYYPASATAAAVTPSSSSPASSTASASPPTPSDMSFHASPVQQATAPAPKVARAPKEESTDFSHLPGMKILTMDGQDVTNSVSRGIKSKEQREHAHLMRVLKACDACKRKKIRCDPSHKRRPNAASASSSASASQGKAVTKAAEASSRSRIKRAKKSPPTPASQSSSSAASFTPAPEASFDVDMAALEAFPPMDDSWGEFLTYGDQLAAPVGQDFYGSVPQDFDFFFSPENQFSPAISGSSGFSNSPAQPLTPLAGSGVLAAHNSNSSTDLVFTGGDNNHNTFAFLQASAHEQPMVPYMNPAGAHGSNYVDFNLYSPASSFLDEEAQGLKTGDKRKKTPSGGSGGGGGSRSPSSSSSSAAAQSPLYQFGGAGVIAGTVSPAALHAQQQLSTGLAHGHEWRFDLSGAASSTLGSIEPARLVQRGEHHQQPDIGVAPGSPADGHNTGAVVSGEQRAWHAGNTDHAPTRPLATRSPSGGVLPVSPQLQTMGRNSPVAVASRRPESHERSALPQVGLGLAGSPTSATSSSPSRLSSRVVSPQVVVATPAAAPARTSVVSATGGNAQRLPLTVCPTELQIINPARPAARLHNSMVAVTAASIAAQPTEIAAGNVATRGPVVVAEGSLHGGLPPTAAIQTRATSAPRASSGPVAAAVTRGPSSALATSSHHAERHNAAPAVLGGLSSTGAAAAAVANGPSSVFTSGLGLRILIPGSQEPTTRQVLHGATSGSASASAARSRLRHVPTPSSQDDDAVPSTPHNHPVRQLPGRPTTAATPTTNAPSRPLVASALALVQQLLASAAPAVLGLVSMLLIVAPLLARSLLGLQLQLQLPPPTLLASCLPSSSSSVILLMLAACSSLWTCSDSAHPFVGKGWGAGVRVGGLLSSRARPSSRRPAWSGPVRGAALLTSF